MNKLIMIERLNITNEIVDKPQYVISAVCTISFGGETWQIQSSEAFEFDINTEQTNFTAFTDLTEEQVLGWCKNQTEKWNTFESRIKESYDQHLALNDPLTKNLPPPWINYSSTSSELRSAQNLI